MRGKCGPLRAFSDPNSCRGVREREQVPCFPCVVSRCPLSQALRWQKPGGGRLRVIVFRICCEPLCGVGGEGLGFYDQVVLCPNAVKLQAADNSPKLPV